MARLSGHDPKPKPIPRSMRVTIPVGGKVAGAGVSGGAKPAIDWAGIAREPTEEWARDLARDLARSAERTAGAAGLWPIQKHNTERSYTKFYADSRGLFIALKNRAPYAGALEHGALYIYEAGGSGAIAEGAANVADGSAKWKGSGGGESGPGFYRRPKKKYLAKLFKQHVKSDATGDGAKKLAKKLNIAARNQAKRDGLAR